MYFWWGEQDELEMIIQVEFDKYPRWPGGGTLDSRTSSLSLTFKFSFPHNDTVFSYIFVLSWQGEQEELERIIQVETDKYSKRRDDRLQEIQSQATDFAQDKMQDGIKDMALQNIIMKRVSPQEEFESQFLCGTFCGWQIFHFILETN